VRSVADEAGVSKTNISYYFPSIVDLLAAAVDELIDATRRRLRAMDLTTIDLDQAVALTMLAIPDTPARRRQSEIWLTLLTGGGVDPHATELLRDFNKRVRAGVVWMLELFSTHGLVGTGRDLNLEATRLHALIDGLSLQTMNDMKMMPPSRIRSVVTHHLTELGHPFG
jgi:AcrR family transcriptional regulator